MDATLVLTTINVPFVLQKYCELINNSSHNINIIVIEDKKTPSDAYTYCDSLSSQFDIHIKFVTCSEQEVLLRSFKDISKYIPWNCIQRRNIGILLSYKYGSEVIITIDDDNIPISNDYFDRHLDIGIVKAMNCINSSNGWVNICEYLVEERSSSFFHRGFPLMKRGPSILSQSVEHGRIVVNAGLWMGDPDVDALTRLSFPLNVIDSKISNNNLTIGNDSWSPFNSQNTAIIRDVIPAYFLSASVGRYDDIWASYIVGKCAKHLGDYLSYGNPLVNHERNAHDLWKDHDSEVLGLKTTDTFIQILDSTELIGNSYRECTLELLESIEKNLADFDSIFKDSITIFIRGYKEWASLFED
jgi:hypothetical protein